MGTPYCHEAWWLPHPEVKKTQQLHHEGSNHPPIHQRRCQGQGCKEWEHDSQEMLTGKACDLGFVSEDVVLLGVEDLDLHTIHGILYTIHTHIYIYIHILIYS